jgi:hypothetical protein
MGRVKTSPPCQNQEWDPEIDSPRTRFRAKVGMTMDEYIGIVAVLNSIQDLERRGVK